MNNLNFQTSQEYKKWWDANHTKLQHYSIYSKGAAIWNAAHPLAAPAVANAENSDVTVIDYGNLPPLPEPLEIDWPELHSQALGCGLEDRNIYHRYEAAEYGWQDGVDKAVERVPEAIYDADQMQAYARAAIAHAAPNAQLVDALRDLLANSGYTTMSDDDLREEAGLGNGNAPILLKARAALASLPPQKEAL